MTDPLVVAKPIILRQNITLSVAQVSGFFSGLFLNLFLAESWRMTRITEALRVLMGRRKDAGVCGDVSLLGWMLSQSKHPMSKELMCWGCVLWEGKCRVAGPDSKHCCVPSMSFMGYEAGGKAGDYTGNMKSKCSGKEVGDGD